MSFINQNYGTFTENDIQRLIRDELKISLLQKCKDFLGAPSYTNCDPHKIT